MGLSAGQSGAFIGATPEIDQATAIGLKAADLAFQMKEDDRRPVYLDLQSGAPHSVDVLISSLGLPVNLSAHDTPIAMTGTRIRDRTVRDRVSIVRQRPGSFCSNLKPQGD